MPEDKQPEAPGDGTVGEDQKTGEPHSAGPADERGELPDLGAPSEVERGAADREAVRQPPEGGAAGDRPPQSTQRQAPAEAASGYRASYTFLVIVTLVNLVADLWSKHWAKTTFEAVRPGGDRRVVIVEDLMNFIFAKNRGGAWGLLQNETEAIRRPFFLIVSVAAIVFIVSLYRKLQPGQTALKWGLPLVLGGALGNLIDRIRYGYVVDFIDVYMEWGGQVKHWPTFNVADISICVGVALMAIDMFTSREKTVEAKPKDEPPKSPEGSEGASKLAERDDKPGVADAR